MRRAAAIAVLLAVVSAALVGVRERSEICRLRYRVFDLERRRDALERQVRELTAGIADALSPRRLLEDHERRAAAGEDRLAGPESGIPVDGDAPATTEGTP